MHTNRLKRKLEDVGIDIHSRKATENFCLFGTPLPPLEKSKDTGEFVPLWKQDVRDEKGRRRLHGAFTGGWSAGYFNTVGSKEGWTPSTFVSSRSERAKANAARPEDFMDEDDLQELKDSRSLINTNEQTDLSGIFGGGTQSQVGQDDANDPLFQSVHKALTLHTSAESSVGVRILRKYGWRPGHGIGPRVSLTERKLQDKEAFDPFTGLRPKTGNLEVDDDDEEAKKHTYPRRDTPVLVVKRKDDMFGLGYAPGMSLHEGGERRGGGGNTGGAKNDSRLAGGFGLGALNDADEDDLDVYDHSAPGNRRQQRVAYDHGLGEEDETITIGRGGGPKPAPTRPGIQQFFRDGRPVLRDFELSTEPVQQDSWFPVPPIPPGWKPDPRRVWEKEGKENVKPTVAPTGKMSHAEWKSSRLTADQRGEALGEAPTEAPARSIFDFISSKDKERLERAAQSASSIAPTVNLPTLEPHIAQAALQGFQPFRSDPVKQARYNAFLLSQTQIGPDGTRSGDVQSVQPLPGQTQQELKTELEDYVKSAMLFKPISGAMAGRFTSASVVEAEPQVQEGLSMPLPFQGRTAEEEEARKKEEEERNMSPALKAARMGMYGVLTREVKSWVPARLLCKRFGVKEPEASRMDEGDKEEAVTTAGGYTYTPTDAEKEFAATAGVSFTPAGSAVDGQRRLDQIGFGEDEGGDILTYERPPMDVFKAIFASDEESGAEDADADADAGDDEVVEAEPPKFTPATSILDDKPFDPTLVPKFIPREGKRKKDDADKSKKDKKDKKDKKAKKKKGLVSFMMDDEAEDVIEEEEQPKKRRKEQSSTSDAKLNAKDPPQPTSTTTPVDAVERKFKGRKSAADFLE